MHIQRVQSLMAPATRPPRGSLSTSTVLRTDYCCTVIAALAHLPLRCGALPWFCACLPLPSCTGEQLRQVRKLAVQLRLVYRLSAANPPSIVVVSPLSTRCTILHHPFISIVPSCPPIHPLPLNSLGIISYHRPHPAVTSYPLFSSSLMRSLCLL